MNRPGPEAVRYWRLDGWLTAAVLIVLAIAATIALWGWGGAWLLLAATPLAVAGLGYAVLMPRLRPRIHSWSLTDTEISTEFGWLVRQRRIAPLTRVQTVDTKQGPVQRGCGVRDVVVTTASSAGAVIIPALTEEDAARLERAIGERIAVSVEDGT